MRTGVGGPIGDALFERSLNALIPYDGLLGSIRELYGFSALVGTVALIVILLMRFRGVASSFAPRLANIYSRLRELSDVDVFAKKLQ